MKPIDLDAQRPHITIQTADGNVHVLPRSLVETWIDGGQPIAQTDEWEPIVRVILREWLASLNRHSDPVTWPHNTMAVLEELAQTYNATVALDGGVNGVIVENTEYGLRYVGKNHLDGTERWLSQEEAIAALPVPPSTIGYRSQGEAETDAAKLSGWSYVRVLQLMELGEPHLDSEGYECWYIVATDPVTGRTAEWTSPTQDQPRFVRP